MKMSNLKGKSGRAWQRVGLRIILSVCLLTVGYNGLALAAEKGPIKIGFLAPTTGNWAQMGSDMIEAFKLYLSEINYTVAGRKVELITEDEGANPATAVTKVRKLIAHDKVHLLAGVFVTNSAYAITPIAIEEKTPLVITIASADDLTQRKASKYVTRIAWATSSEFGYLCGDYAYRKLGWRKAAVLGFDYAWGYEVGGGFQRSFEELGGQVTQRIWAPVNTTDFGPYVTSIKRDVDGVCSVITGAASIRFINSFRVSDHKGGLIGPGHIVDETFLPALGDSALGIHSITSYSAAWETPENAQFKEKLQKALKREPNGTLAINYTAADAIVHAINSIHGDVEDRDKFVEALRGIQMSKSVCGPLKVDKHGMVVLDMLVRRVDKVKNQYQNTVIDKYVGPTQFWKFDPETILKEPSYSRDFPTCKYCN
jgi:branched-chain amino acid transport system substrate-binding protein